MIIIYNIEPSFLPWILRVTILSLFYIFEYKTLWHSITSSFKNNFLVNNENQWTFDLFDNVPFGQALKKYYPRIVTGPMTSTKRISSEKRCYNIFSITSPFSLDNPSYITKDLLIHHIFQVKSISDRRKKTKKKIPKCAADNSNQIST